MTIDSLLDRRARLLGPVYRLFYDAPLHVVKGEGVWLYDETGKPYLDCYNNVACVGHCRPEVVEAIASQAALLNVHTRYLNADLLDYAEKLLATFPGPPGQLILTCTGSEANDLALRIAAAHTGGTGFVVTSNAYHGGTEALARLSPSLGPAVSGGPAMRTVDPPDPIQERGDSAASLASRISAAFADMRASGIRPAAFIVDSVMSSDGIFVDPPGVLRAAQQAAHEAGALFICDEVQAGFGRTGDSFWGFERHRATPDIVTIGKPMGNGHPIAGLVVRPEIVAELGRRSRYFNTFGGNPVSVAAAHAVLDVIARDRLLDNVRSTGDYLRARILEVAARHPLVAEVRGVGLFLGLELLRLGAPATREAHEVVNAMRREGVLIGVTGRHGNVLKIRPPLIFAPVHADRLAEALDRGLEWAA